MAIKIPYMVNETVGGGQLGKMNMIPPDFRGIAKAIGATGDMATEYFTRKQMERNDTVARKVQTDFTNEALRLEAELAQYKGEQAIGKKEEFDKKWADYVKGYSESEGIAGNANHLKAVEFFGSKFGGDLSNTVAKYEITQGDVWRESVLQRQAESTSAKVGSLAVGKGWGAIQASMPEVDDIAQQMTDMNGQDFQLNKMKVMTGLIQSYARQETNPQLLLDALNNSSGLVDENIRAQLEGGAQSKLDSKIGQSFGADLFMQGVGQVEAVKTIMAKYPDNDNARSSALATYTQFKSAQSTDRAEYQRQQSELANQAFATGVIPDGLDQENYKRQHGTTIGEAMEKNSESKSVSALDAYNAQTAFTTGVIAMSKASSPQQVLEAMNLAETVIRKVSPKLAEQYSVKLADVASKVGKPEYLESMSKVETQLKTTFFQLSGREYKTSKQGDSKDEKLYNQVLGIVMANPALQNADGIKQTFLDQSRIVKEGWFSDTQKFQEKKPAQKQLKEAVNFGININANGSAGYGAFAKAGILDEDGLIKTPFRKVVLDISDRYYKEKGVTPTAEVIVAILKDEQAKKK
jgi:hypothetical protein